MTTTRQETDVIAPPAPGRWRLFGVFAIASLVVAQVVAVVISPPDRDMGHLQKIMYVHFPIALNMFVCYLVVLIGSVRYLMLRSERADLLAASAAEVGAVMTGLTLALGMLWAKPTWGVWWAWDPRLTSTLVLFLLATAYLALRAFVDDPERRATWSATVGILGALNVPIVYMSVRWWRTLHQVQSSPSSLDPEYVIGVRLNLTAVLLVTVYLIHSRYAAALTERAAENRAMAAALGANHGG